MQANTGSIEHQDDRLKPWRLTPGPSRVARHRDE
jgi:hypothetical protein